MPSLGKLFLCYTPCLEIFFLMQGLESVAIHLTLLRVWVHCFSHYAARTPMLLPLSLFFAIVNSLILGLPSVFDYFFLNPTDFRCD